MYSVGIDNVIIVSKNFGYVPFRGSVCLQDTRVAQVRRYQDDAGHVTKD
jgi:hypothetical protein